MTGPIIVTTDFHARADRAIDRAIALGKQTGREVIVFHGRSLDPGKEEDAHTISKKIRAVLPPGAGDVQIATEIGHVPQNIAACADANNADLIVMGVAKHNSLGDFILGTVVDDVIRRTPRPVLVVKQRPQAPYAKIAIATDFSVFSLAATGWAADFFPNAQLHLLHAFHMPYQAWNNAEYVVKELESYATEEMQSFVGDLPPDIAARVTTHIANGTVSGAMHKLIASEGIDCVVLGSHGESGFRHAMIGSQANDLLTSVPVDTAIIGPQVTG